MFLTNRSVWVPVSLALVISLSGHGKAVADSAWMQWGGPRRNFMVEATGLATTWPAEGPRRLWQRPLGEGHSSIVADGQRLYTVFRPVPPAGGRSQQEKVIALDVATGKTMWEHTYDAPTEGLDFEYGAGPHSTPLIVSSRLYAMSTLKQLFALDVGTGKVIWSHDLIKEYGSPKPGRGYASSPIQYKQTVIVQAGGNGQSLMAFDLQSGALAWKNGSFMNAPASPILITVDGQDQLVVFGGAEIVGVDPGSGSTLWSHPHKTEWGLNISTPVWGEGNLLLVSAAYDSGARLLQLARKGDRTTVRERWFQNRMRTHIGTIIRLGEMAVGSSGDFGPCPTVGIDLKTGNVLWQSRDFARSTFVHADGKLIVLDEDGNLGLAEASQSGLKFLTRAGVLSNKAWTPPTLVGTRLYLRDRRVIMALELGR